MDHVYHYTTPHETVICDSNGMTGNHISLIGAILMFAINRQLIFFKNLSYRGSS